MTHALNSWLKSTVRAGSALCEDSDRACFAAREFEGLIKRVHRIATANALRCPRPKLERFQSEESSPSLMFEWHDEASGWHLYFCVRRGPQVRPFVQLDFGGASKSYSKDKPTDADIAAALADYFENWKHEP